MIFPVFTQFYLFRVYIQNLKIYVSFDVSVLVDVFEITYKEIILEKASTVHCHDTILRVIEQLNRGIPGSLPPALLCFV